MDRVRARNGRKNGRSPGSRYDTTGDRQPAERANRRQIHAPRAGLDGKRILVTGASGFIGSHLVERLVREGAHVVALARTVGKLERIVPRGRYSLALCDVTDADATRRTVAAAA